MNFEFEGNAIADAYVYHNLKDADDINGTKVYISLVNAGSIRATLNRGRKGGEGFQNAYTQH